MSVHSLSCAACNFISNIAALIVSKLWQKWEVCIQNEQLEFLAKNYY